MMFGAIAVAGGLVAGAAGAATLAAGPQGDGTAVTPWGTRITPAGIQRTLGDKPLAIATSPDGGTLVVSNDGQSTQSLQVIDAATSSVIQTISYSNQPAPGSKQAEALFYGLAFSPDGTRLYASAGGNDKIRVFAIGNDRHLTETTSIPAGVAGTHPFPAGLAVSPDGTSLFVANNLADSVSRIDLASGTIAAQAPVGHNPLAVAISADGERVYVTNQGESSVSVKRAADLGDLTKIPVGTHPNDIRVNARRGTVFVANGDSDSVSVLTDTVEPTATRTIDLSPYAGAPVGSTPDGLAVDPDGSRLYVAMAGNNDVDVVDLAQGQGDPQATAGQDGAGRGARDRVAGMIPTGWYPSALAVAPDGGRLFVTNAKGLGAGPNDTPLATAPNPYQGDPNPAQYSGSMIVGTLSTIAVPHGHALDAYTAQVAANNDFANGSAVRGGGGDVVPRTPGEQSPIKHVIYVVKENRTFDQEMGSLGKGNGKAANNLFGDESAPNARELQRRFVTLDNFYADGEISGQGWNWVTGAASNPYVEQTWEANYSPRGRSYDFEGGNPATAPNADPTNAYLWDRLANAGVSARNYGFFKFGHTLNGSPGKADPRLAAIDDPSYNGYDLKCPDSAGTFTPAASANCGTPRVDEWLKEFDHYTQDGQDLPTVEMVRLPNDHTAGTKPGSPTPRAYVADNDLALGRLVDAVSHSRYWASTAIFVTEDDAQNGPDHVDAHRTVSQVISPYTQTGRVDSTFYSTVSMLRTIELLTGLAPLTQFDAYAQPMSNAFNSTPDLRPFEHLTPGTSVMQGVNGASAPLAKASAAQDTTNADQADATVLNEAIWKSVKGGDAAMPAPRHAAGPVPGSAGPADTDG